MFGFVIGPIELLILLAISGGAAFLIYKAVGKGR
jgi:hypothetical protein